MDRGLLDGIGSRGMSVGRVKTHADSRHHGVRSAGEQFEHRRGVGLVMGLAEDLAVDDHRRVGREHDRPWSTHRSGLLASEPGHVVGGGFSRPCRLVDVGRLDREVEREAFEQLPASRRAGGEHQEGRGHSPILASRGRSDTSRGHGTRTVGAIDEHDDDDRLLIPLPGDETDEDIRPDEFAPTTGFLRAGTEDRGLPRFEPGPPWSYDEADERAHEFLDVLATDRPVEYHDDPVEQARANGLMILFGHAENEAFATLLARMPAPRAEAWLELMSGGASSEAFGPLTLQEKLDEHQVDEALQAGRKQRIVNLIAAAVVVVVAVGGGIAAWALLLDGDDRTEGALQFDTVDEDPAVASVEGGPPVAEPLLVEVLDEAVVVVEGAGDRETRVALAPTDAHRQLPGALAASLFQYAAAGQLVVAGPAGFIDDICLRASVVTSDLRPLDTVWFGDCASPIGRPATVGCLGADAVLLALRIPPGEVELPEGGTGFADAVRIQSLTEDVEGHEVVSVRATISVPADSDIVIPRFGGEIGADITFDLGDDRRGTCKLTGDFPL